MQAKKIANKSMAGGRTKADKGGGAKKKAKTQARKAAKKTLSKQGKDPSRYRVRARVKKKG